MWAASFLHANANEGLALPPPPSGPGGEDAITTSVGSRCSQSINSNGPYLDLGVAGYRGIDRDYGYLDNQDNDQEPGGFAYARVIVPLGEQPQRINCNTLYELEIRRLREEIELMKIGIE